MAMFIGHIALVLNVLALAAGFVVLHQNSQLRGKFLVWAAWILIGFGALGTACTSYFLTKYYFHGHFEHAYQWHGSHDGAPVDAHHPGSSGD